MHLPVEPLVPQSLPLRLLRFVKGWLLCTFTRLSSLHHRPVSRHVWASWAFSNPGTTALLYHNAAPTPTPLEFSSRSVQYVIMTILLEYFTSPFRTRFSAIHFPVSSREMVYPIVLDSRPVLGSSMPIRISLVDSPLVNMLARTMV